MPFYTFKCPKCKKEKDVLARIKWKAKDVTITEMKPNEVEE